jgi:hypothetical protein
MHAFVFVSYTTARIQNFAISDTIIHNMQYMDGSAQSDPFVMAL